MTLPEPPASITSRLSALAQRLGLGSRVPRLVFERARVLRLPFMALPAFTSDIWWHSGPPLQRLVDLPRDALSGPVQEDKAAARAVLMRVVECEVQHLDNFDLRRIDGLCSKPRRLEGELNSFEELASSPLGRCARIISYKDFLKTITLAMPGFQNDETVAIRQANWHSERLYWNSEQHAEEFACAIAYARLRGLEITRPAELTHYRLSESGLAELRRLYHMTAMPVQAWSEPAFMSLLLDHGLPYARLSLLRYDNAPEFLLLPKASEISNALGEGLRQAGAPDVIAYLEALQRR